MKLKKTEKEGIAVITLTENLDLKDLEILRAGLARLVQTSPQPFLVDLTQLPEDAAVALSQWGTHCTLIQRQTGVLPLFLARPEQKLPGVATETDPKAALEKLNAPLTQLSYSEARLQKKLEDLTPLKLAADSQAKIPGGLDSELKALRQENGKLRRMVRGLERALEALAKTRTPPLSQESAPAKRQEVEKILLSVLKQQGLLPSQGGSP